MQTSAMVHSPGVNVEGSTDPELSDEIDAMIASFSPQVISQTAGNKAQAQAKASRFRVKWHADILIDDRAIDHGFISDISTWGASIYLEHNVHPLNPKLLIHLPPLSQIAQPHFIEVSGKTIYVVYDGERQLYRASIHFVKFHVESDLAYLDERLTKYHSRIPEH